MVEHIEKYFRISGALYFCELSQKACFQAVRSIRSQLIAALAFWEFCCSNPRFVKSILLMSLRVIKNLSIEVFDVDCT